MMFLRVFDHNTIVIERFHELEKHQRVNLKTLTQADVPNQGPKMS